jgi:hypothetical protein
VNGKGGLASRPQNRHVVGAFEGIRITGIVAIDAQLAARVVSEGAVDAALGRRRNPYSERCNPGAAALWEAGFRAGVEFLDAAQTRHREGRARPAAEAQTDEVVALLRETAA